MKVQELLGENGVLKESVMRAFLYHPELGFAKVGNSKIEELNYLRALPLLRPGWQDPDGLRGLKIERYLEIEKHWFDSIYKRTKNAFTFKGFNVWLLSFCHGEDPLDSFIQRVLTPVVWDYERHYLAWAYEINSDQPTASDYIKDYEGSVKRSSVARYCIEPRCWGKVIPRSDMWPARHCQAHHINLSNTCPTEKIVESFAILPKPETKTETKEDL